VDFAPTLLSLAGVKPPEWMDGHAFLGKFQEAPQPFIYGFRGRMDERYDLVRSVTDGRYVYVRNYMPHLIYGQHLNYMWQTPTTRVWEKLHNEGKLNAAQDKFWNRKPPEELFDLQSDPDEVNNLADSPVHQEIKAKLRAAQQGLARKIRDVGFVPEGERLERAEGGAPYDFGHGDKYPFERVFETAERASMMMPDAVSDLKKAMKDPDSAVRYWGVLGLLMRGKPALEEARAEVQAALKDRSAYVRIVAAQVLGQFGGPDDLKTVLPLLVKAADWEKNSVFVSLAALSSIDALGQKAAPVAGELKALPSTGPVPDDRLKTYVPRLLEELRARFP
jgi:uncharacterized sulfatase